MVMKNRKAFTLIEVLAVIVILGILSTIGIVAVTNIRKNQEKKFDQTQYELFRETAKTYFSDHKSKLPTIAGGTNEVYLEDLINENYLDSLLDYRKNSYDLNSNVQITKLGENLYTYIVDLHKDGSSTSIRDIDDTDSDKGIVFENYRKKTDDKTDKLGYDENKDKEIEIYYSNKTITMDLNISDDQGIMAYCYRIIKNNIIVFNSEYILGYGKNDIDDILALDINNYRDGTYQIEVVVYDSKNHIKSNRSKKVMVDTVAPACNVTKIPNLEWTNKDTTIEASCSDNQGKKNNNSGCKSKPEKQTLTTEGIYNKSLGTVEDKAGNKTKCDQITVKIDKTKPTCTTTGEKTTWTNNNRTLTFTCNDNKGKNNSGCKVEKVTKTFSTTAKTKKLTGDDLVKVTDKAGNAITCKSAYNTNSVGNPTTTFNIYVDKDEPKCTWDGESTNWTNKSRTINVKCSDDNSGCKSSTYKVKTYKIDTNKSENGSVKTETLTKDISDQAGNIKTCKKEVNVYVDYKKPEIPDLYRGYQLYVANNAENPYYVNIIGEKFSIPDGKHGYKLVTKDPSKASGMDLVSNISLTDVYGYLQFVEPNDKKNSLKLSISYTYSDKSIKQSKTLEVRTYNAPEYITFGKTVSVSAGDKIKVRVKNPNATKSYTYYMGVGAFVAKEGQTEIRGANYPVVLKQNGDKGNAASGFAMVECKFNDITAGASKVVTQNDKSYFVYVPPGTDANISVNGQSIICWSVDKAGNKSTTTKTTIHSTF